MTLGCAMYYFTSKHDLCLGREKLQENVKRGQQSRKDEKQAQLWITEHAQILPLK